MKVRRRSVTPSSREAYQERHDDCIRKNTQFRHDAGLKCYIIRIGTKCCEWCSEVAGKYEFGDQPDGIFRRHDNCDCTIIYDGQVLRGKQNADGSRSKTWEELPNANAADYTPTTLSETEGRAIERRNLARFRSVKINNSSIDFSTERDIIIARSEKPATKDDIIKFEVELKQLGIKSVTGFEEFVENNEYLNEIIEDFKKLSYDFSDYFKDLKLSFGGTSKLGIRDYACYNPESKTIHLNPVFYNDFRKYFDCYSADVRENYHPKGTTYRATIFHEFGHHIEESKSIKPKIEAKKQFETFNGRYFTRKMSDQWVSDNLSEYAWQFDYGEFISESFAEYYNSQQPRELAKAVVNKIVNGR